MNILNNIWLAVSTPNENLINLISIFFTILVEVPLSFSLISNIFNVTCSNLKKLIYILITSFFAILAMKIIPWPFNVIINDILAFIIIYKIFKLSIFKTIIASVFPGIFFSVLQSIVLNPYLAIFNLTYNEIETIPIYRIPFAITIYLIAYSLNLIIKHKKFKLTILDDFDNKNKSIIILNFIFGLINVIIQMIITVNYIDILPLYFSIFNVISLLIYFTLSIYSLTRVMKLVTTTQKLESAEEYNKTLHILHDSVRGFKHDFDNIVTTIGGYIKTNDMEGLEKYYSQLQEDCSKVNNLYILNPDIINNPGIYNLLTTKYSEAEEKGIKVNLTFLLDLNDLHMKIYEFARILGILLDNSIDAASECEEKELNIVFRNETKNSRNIILIENTYKDKDVNIEQIFNKGVTGKENHTGLGLWEIRQILKKNNNVNLYTNKNEKYFSQQLEIYY